MRSTWLAALFTLGVAVAQASPPAPAARLDHVLLWGRGIDPATSILAVKLGFQVRPGHDPGGVANRYVRFADGGYIELLAATRPDPAYDPGEKQDVAALQGGPGARTFGIRSASLDAIHAALKQLGYAVTPFFTGPGGSKQPGWRLFAFDRAPLSSNTFFIDYANDYAPDQYDPANADDYRATREHPNSARELSAIWLLSNNAESDREQLARMGFGNAVAVTLSAIAAKGYCVPVGPTAVLVLQPDGAGTAAGIMAHGVPRIAGVSIGVADLGRAQRWVERGYERDLAIYSGLSGKSFLAPTWKDLGILLEFHAIRSGATACANPIRAMQ